MDVEVFEAMATGWLSMSPGWFVVLLRVLNVSSFVRLTRSRRWMSAHQCVKCGTVRWLAVSEVTPRSFVER